MDLYQTKIPAPSDWQQLQRIAKDFYKFQHGDCSVDEYGTQGQAQDGVDIYIYSERVSIGVQCKCVQELSEAALIDEVNKAKKFKNKLDRYVLVVTTNRNTKLVNLAANLARSSGMLVEIMFWQSMAEEMASHKQLSEKYLKFAVVKYASASTVHVELEAEDSYYNFIVTNMAGFYSDRSKKKFQEGLLLVTSIQGRKKSSFHTLGGGHWTDFEGVVGCTELDAFIGWRWFGQFSSFEEIMANSEGKQIFCLSKQDINKFRSRNDEEE